MTDHKDLTFEYGSDDHVATVACVRYLFGGMGKFRALAFAMTRPIGVPFTAREMDQANVWGSSANFGTAMKRAAEVNMATDHGLQKDYYSHPFSRTDSPLWNIVEMAMHVLGIDGAHQDIYPEDLAETRKRLLRLEKRLARG
jgi:hypothetical protein